MRSLLIGCGKNLTKQIQIDGNPEWTGKLTTMDINPNIGADVVFDMEIVANGGRLPFDDNTMSEVGAFNCIEHWGRQGDFRGFFWEMGEYWRILKPGGMMSILVPIGADAFADPGHTRFFSKNHFGFLNQEFYSRQVILDTCFTDYRGWAWTKNFDVVYMEEHGGHHIAVVLKKA